MNTGIRNFLKVTGTFKTLSALHIGANRSLDPIESDNPVIKDKDGKPLIPGSSLKGIFRSTIEGILRGMGVSNVCSPADAADDDYCVKRKDWDNCEVIEEKVCPVCRLFGSPFMASKITFMDASVKGEWKDDFYAVRDGVVIDRESRTAANKKKFDFETVAAGTEFKFEITLKNFEDYEIGILAIALDILNEGFVALGGNTSRGLGKVSISVDGVKQMTEQSLRNYFEGKGSLTEDKEWEILKERGLKALEAKLKEWKKGGDNV